MTDIIHDYAVIASRMLGEHRPKPKPPTRKRYACLTCNDRGAILNHATGRSEVCPDCEPLS